MFVLRVENLINFDEFDETILQRISICDSDPRQPLPPVQGDEKDFLLAMVAEKLHHEAKCSLRLLLDIPVQGFRFFWVLMFSDWRFRERIMFL